MPPGLAGLGDPHANAHSAIRTPAGPFRVELTGPGDQTWT